MILFFEKSRIFGPMPDQLRDRSHMVITTVIIWADRWTSSAGSPNWSSISRHFCHLGSISVTQSSSLFLILRDGIAFGQTSSGDFQKLQTMLVRFKEIFVEKFEKLFSEKIFWSRKYFWEFLKISKFSTKMFNWKLTFFSIRKKNRKIEKSKKLHFNWNFHRKFRDFQKFSKIFLNFKIIFRFSKIRIFHWKFFKP